MWPLCARKAPQRLSQPSRGYGPGAVTSRRRAWIIRHGLLPTRVTEMSARRGVKRVGSEADGLQARHVRSGDLLPAPRVGSRLRAWNCAPVASDSRFTRSGHQLVVWLGRSPLRVMFASAMPGGPRGIRLATRHRVMGSVTWRPALADFGSTGCAGASLVGMADCRLQPRGSNRPRR